MPSNQTKSGTWTRVDASGDVPKGRSSNASGIIDQKLYVFSGEHDPRNPVDGDVYELNFQSKQWRRAMNQADTWPQARVGHAATTANGKFYMYGGRGNADSHDTMGDFWSFDPSVADVASAWSRLPLKGTPPPPLSYHTMTSDGKCVYVFGGCTADGRSNQIWAFDLNGQEWQQLTTESMSNQPGVRGGSSIVAANDGLHVLFGYNGKQELMDHWLWNMTSKQWEEISSASGPAARSVTDVVYLSETGDKGALFVFGGEFTPSAQGHLGAGSYHNDAWLFDIASRQWSKVDASGSAPSARGWFNTVALDGKSAVVFGGFDGKDRVNDVCVWKSD